MNELSPSAIAQLGISTEMTVCVDVYGYWSIHTSSPAARAAANGRPGTQPREGPAEEVLDEALAGEIGEPEANGHAGENGKPEAPARQGPSRRES